MQNFSLENYLSNGIDRIVNGVIKNSWKNPGAALFLVRHGVDSRKARAIRKEAELRGEHTPPFLMASITDQCNLHCKGCYARANGECGGGGGMSGVAALAATVNTQKATGICGSENVMTRAHWDSVFAQAEDMGIEFILLAGGEPFTRKEILETAGAHSKILFPVFTNGTMLDDSYITLLEAKRNLLPVLSVEGSKQTTDRRRGEGIYSKILESMKRLQARGILFGLSVTVTKDNLGEVLADEFVSGMAKLGVRAIIYVEYVPVDVSTRALAPDDRDRMQMKDRLKALRSRSEAPVLIAFPGDEKAFGGCLAAGRGFFHINPYGAVEPCPFSPYSDTNLKENTLAVALRSPLFQKLQTNGSLLREHEGGCTLFDQREEVALLLKE